jgi:hypothetical protein
MMTLTHVENCRKMRTVVVIATLVTLVGCTKPVNDWSTSHNVGMSSIPGLEDCTYRQIYTGAVTLYVIRCPHSTVSVQASGKTPITTVTESK